MIADLTPKEIRFCDEYLISFNATKAATAAGYSKRTAASIGSEMLKKEKIRRYLQVKKKRIVEKLEITQERTMKEIARVAFADPRTLFNEDGTFKIIPELGDDQAAIIASFEQEELFAGSGKERLEIGATKKVKLWNKLPALEMLAKHFKIFEEKDPPPPVNLVGLNQSELKTLLAMKKKVAK